MVDFLVLSPKKAVHRVVERRKDSSARIESIGFSLLDLGASQIGKDILHEVEHMFDLSAATFGLDKSVLDRYAPDPPRDLLRHFLFHCFA